MTTLHSVLADFDQKYDRSVMGEEIVEQVALSSKDNSAFALLTIVFIDGTVKLEASLLDFIKKEKVSCKEIFGYENVRDTLKKAFQPK